MTLILIYSLLVVVFAAAFGAWFCKYDMLQPSDLQELAENPAFAVLILGLLWPLTFPVLLTGILFWAVSVGVYKGLEKFEGRKSVAEEEEAE